MHQASQSHDALCNGTYLAHPGADGGPAGGGDGPAQPRRTPHRAPRHLRLVGPAARGRARQPPAVAVCRRYGGMGRCAFTPSLFVQSGDMPLS